MPKLALIARAQARILSPGLSVGRKEGFTWMRDGDANPNEIDAASDLSAGFHAAAVLAHCRQMFGLE